MVWQFWVLRGRNANNPPNSCARFPPWNVTVSLKRKIYLVVLIVYTSVLHFWDRYGSLLSISVTTTDLLKCPSRSPCNGRKGNNTGCQSHYLPALERFVCFRWRMQSWQRKNKTPLCQNTSWRWFPSLLPSCQRHTNPEQPWAGIVFMVLLSHPSKQHTEPPKQGSSRKDILGCDV